jgi:hypothetical protein
MSYVSTATGKAAGVEELGGQGPGNYNSATGFITFAKAPAPTALRLEKKAFQHAARTAANRNSVARRFIQSPSFARRSQNYRTLTPRPASQPAPKQRNYNLLRTFERVIQPDVQQTVTLAVKQLKPVRQVMKMASAASGYNFG